MKVTLIDVDQPDRKIDGQYTIDTTVGAPAVGDEVYLLERDYNPDRYYLAATVRRRCWRYADNKPGGAELQLWVQRQGK
ncbi:hypothetical protein [Paractinoplanes toevensis]|uniref:Uncharacterized protein n=1 Tax=Paractinoplanes toevensis TaxID=571911 RepID=A0A919T3V4_9ACTN|nr:hypothetical protein [Actinoplanes toevensis]GIM88733.1 hypothetical protein Ato02nite_005260 [Actinoplanes toevensis]